MASFRSKVAGSSDLQISLTDAMKKGPEAVIALGAANGCNFDDADLQATASRSDLTDFELELLSGGIVDMRIVTERMGFNNAGYKWYKKPK